ncbi:TPA: hypothetical protein ACM3YL_005123, partial [Escherichia coli]
RAEASFRNNHPAYRYGSATVTSPFISWRHIPDYFLRFSPVVMPVKVVRCFHHQRRLRLTTSGGTFS